MKKNTEIVSGFVNEEHPFHQVQTQPGKAKKHRYERRKVRNILKIEDWGEAEEYEDAVALNNAMSHLQARVRARARKG